MKYFVNMLLTLTDAVPGCLISLVRTVCKYKKCSFLKCLIISLIFVTGCSNHQGWIGKSLPRPAPIVSHSEFFCLALVRLLPSRNFFRPRREPDNFVPRVSHLRAHREEEGRNPGAGWSRATLTIEGIKESSDATQFVALSFLEFKATHYDCHYPRCLKAISNSIYSNVYLKIRQVCLEAIYRSRDVVAVLPTGYMERQSCLSSSSVVPQENQLWTSSNAISSRINCLFLL